ncbi:hypothetical protein NC653_030049 [Populus alba x Populus x berolinensis]|uniref:Uncharacterized protein n=1 Tax=Populus alba x Populus x berolinensis TaxID=444605 RepID=A0AAD6Q485_9ROSI|nr:hypothetical protein NC653_030049 [Populus alba x Populus x berolinensis]
MEGCWIFMVQVADMLLIVLYREEKVARVGRSCAAASMKTADVAAHGLEELLGLECWSLTALVQEEVALLEKLHH